VRPAPTIAQQRAKRLLHTSVTMTERQAKRVASGNKLSTPSDYRIPKPDEIEAGRVRKAIEERRWMREYGLTPEEMI
jgi:hypothetical protein